MPDQMLLFDVGGSKGVYLSRLALISRIGASSGATLTSTRW